MTKYHEILRLKSLGFSERNIAQSCGVSRNTVAKVLKKAAEINLSWPLDFDMTDSALEELMFPKDKSATNKRMPNFNYIRKELLRNGVNKKLLWVEYCEECRMSSEEPLMYSQFCYYIQKDEEKCRATMHIPRKPGEQIEVDWAGDPAHIIDPDTGEITDAWIFVGVLTYSQYAFVKAYMNEKTDNWIKAHIQMFGRNTRNIWNGTVTGSVSGLIRLELTQVRLSMQYLPPAGLNSNPTEAAWDY